MKMISVICLSVLVSAAYATEMKSGGFNSVPNTEFGFGTQTVSFGFRGGYSTITDDITVKLVKVTKDSSTGTVTEGAEVSSFTISDAEEKKKQTFMTLTVPDSEIPSGENTQLYAVKFCEGSSGNDCSELSPPGIVDFGSKKMLNCDEVDSEIGQIEAQPLKGYADSTALGPISANENSTMKIQGYAEGKYRQQKKVGTNWMLYFVFDFDLSPYKKMLTHPGRSFYCSRKYTASILTLIIDETSKRVERAFKFTPVLSQPVAAFLSTKKSFPLEVEHTVGTTKLTGEKIIWHTLCFTDKDLIGGAVKCTEPFRQKDGKGDIAWKIDTDTIGANGNANSDL